MADLRICIGGGFPPCSSPRASPRRIVLRVTDVEARLRLSSILSVLEHGGHALRALEDGRLDEVLRTVDSCVPR